MNENPMTVPMNSSGATKQYHRTERARANGVTTGLSRTAGCRVGDKIAQSKPSHRKLFKRAFSVTGNMSPCRVAVTLLFSLMIPDKDREADERERAVF